MKCKKCKKDCLVSELRNGLCNDCYDDVIKTKKPLYTKWWFWIILLAIICVVGFTIIMVVAFNTIKGDVGDLAIEIKRIYKDAIVYSSAGSDILYIELRNWDSNYSTQLSKIISTVKTKVEKNELITYNKFITLSYMKSSGNEEGLVMRMSYNLPDFSKNEEDSKAYILFDEYQKLFNTYDKAMEGYTGLFNSIY